MEKGPSKPADSATAQVTAEESLNEALSSLEQILEGREERLHTPPDPVVEPPAHGSIEDAQYTIPLLHDVVSPGTESTLSDERQSAHPGPVEADEGDAEVCRRLVERLANEIEIIVQTRIEAAVQDAADDIREKIRNHLDIMLPEILEELNVLTRRRRE